MDGLEGIRERWRGKVQSRTSSLSMRGIRSSEAKDWAKVLLPVPGWPFMAIITGLCCFAIPSALVGKIVDISKASTATWIVF